MKKWHDNEDPRKREAARRSLMNGSYSIAAVIIAIAVIVVLNLIIGAIPEKFTTLDVSDQKLYSIGDISKGVLDALDEDVELCFITQTGQEDEAVWKLLESYAACSDRIRLREIDAVENPTFASQYSDETIPLNSVIAVCGSRTKVASSYRFYGYDSYYSAASSWDAEGQITSAIASAALGNEAKAYYTAGHDELPISAEMQDSMEKANIAFAELNLLTDEIPSDCSVLIVFAPSQDFTEEEVKKVRSWLENGGRLLLLTMSAAVTGKETPNLDRILSDYGISRKGGLVMEGNEGAYVQAPYLILPETGKSVVTEGLSNENIICALPEAIDTGDTDEAVYTVTSLLLTSPDAYIKQEIEDTVARSDSDESGTFVLGVAVEETFSRDSFGSPDVDLGEAEKEEEQEEKHPTRILYYSTPCLFSSAALSTLIQQETSLPAGNIALFSKSMAYLTDQDTAVAVEAKTLQVPQTVIDTRTQSVLGIGFMVVLPVCVLAGGIFIFMRRRRR